MPGDAMTSLHRLQPLWRGYETGRQGASISYAVLRIFAAMARDPGRRWRWTMAHFLTDEKYRDLIYDDDYRSFLMAQRDAPGGYRFGRTQAKRVRRSALRRLNGCFKSMIEAIANSKLRRMQRELELRGIRYDRPGNDWPARKSAPAERS
jgi:hypothetical protein